MPEAVASNSIPMPERQLTLYTASEILDALSDAEDAFYALGEFAVSEVERTGDKRAAAGLSYLFRRETDELHELRSALVKLFMDAKEPKKSELPMPSAAEGLWPELYGRVSALVMTTMAERGSYVPEDDITAWSKEDRDEWIIASGRYYNLIGDRLKGSRDAMEAGSFLPWLEMRMRKEILVENTPPMSEQAPALRDRLILQQARMGITSQELSQAFSLRRGAVERIIARLSEADEGARKAG